jgi:hypothetical protein
MEQNMTLAKAEQKHELLKSTLDDFGIIIDTLVIDERQRSLYDDFAAGITAYSEAEIMNAKRIYGIIKSDEQLLEEAGKVYEKHMLSRGKIIFAVNIDKQFGFTNQKQIWNVMPMSKQSLISVLVQKAINIFRKQK